jgi:predicted DNA-binding protein
MATCGSHGVELFVLDDGLAVCPLCQASQLDAEVARGQYPQPQGGYVAVPAEKGKPISIRMSERDIHRAKVLSRHYRVGGYQTLLKEIISKGLDALEEAYLDPEKGQGRPYKVIIEAQRGGLVDTATVYSLGAGMEVVRRKRR